MTTSHQKLQTVWDAQDLDGVKSMFTADAVMLLLHEGRTLRGEE